MKKLFIIFLSALSIHAATEIRFSAVTLVTNIAAANSYFLVNVITGSSTNSYRVPLEILIREGITNSSTLNWTITGNKLVGWPTNLTSAEIGDTINFAVVTVNPSTYGVGWDGSTNVATQGDIYAKIETLSVGGSSVFVNGASVSAPNIKTGTNILAVVSDSTNIFFFPTNIVGNMLVNDTLTGTQIDESTLGEVPTATLATTAGAGDNATGFFPAGTIEAARLPNISGLNGQAADTQIADGAVDGGAGGEIADNTITADDVAANAIGNSEASDTLAFDVLTVNYDIYGAGWATSTNVPTKRAVYDKIEALVIAGGDGTGNWTAVGTTNSSLNGQASMHSQHITNSQTLGDGTTAMLEAWPLGGIITNAGNGVSITNDIPYVFNLNVTNNADLFLGSTNVAGALALKAPLASPALTGNPTAPTPAVDDGDTSIATSAFVLGQFLNTAPAVTWNGVTAKVPNADRLHDWIVAGDPDYDGLPSVFDPTGTAGIVNVNSSGVAQTPLTTRAGLAAIITDLNSATRTHTGVTFDAAGTGNVLKFKSYIWLKGFDNMTGATIGNVTDTNLSTFMKPVFDDAADQAANYIEWQIQVPDDIDTTVEPLAKITYKLTGADTGGQVYVLSHASVAASAAYDGTPGTAITFAANTDASGASGDVEQTVYTTLTGWGAAVTAGRHWVIRLARDGDAAGDTSTVDSMFSMLTIEYGVSQ